MAILNSSLALLLNAGLGTDGKTIVKRKVFQNIKPEATDQQLLNIAVALGPLQQYSVISTERTNNIDLVN